MMREVLWESWQQWHHVRCCFFSNSPARIAEALDRVSAWQSRGDLPVAVEITAELVSIQQRDPYINTDVSPSIALPGEMLRMMYAMAIMRLVNGVVDQSVRCNTSSVANRAEDARLPLVFVDILHETAHNWLPSLPLVRRASKQALAWLLKNYWEEQEQLLSDTQDALKTKLIEHAQVMYEILVAQQRLLSKEVRTEDYKLQRLTLKRALKGKKRQQQALLKELLELTGSGTCELVSLLVKQGLLLHDLNPSCSYPKPSNESRNRQNNIDLDEIPEFPSSSDDISATVRHEDNSVAAWKHTCAQLAEHMPRLPTLLLSSIIKILTVSSCESSSKLELKGNLATSFCEEELVEWATWILDQSSSLSKKKKSQHGLRKFIGTGADLQMHAVFTQDTLKELAHICKRSRMDQESVVKIISHLSPLVNDGSFSRRAESLAGCSIPCTNEGNMKDQKTVQNGVEIEDSEKNFVVQHHESNSRQDLKRKAIDAQIEGTPEIDPKRVRIQDQLMSEEATTACHAENDSGTNYGNDVQLVLDEETRGMECEGDELIESMDEDQMFLDDGVAGKVDCSIDCTMESKPPSNSSNTGEVNVAWQGYLLQSGILQLGALQELPNLQAAIRVL